jgi:hypothetical protein
MIVFYLCIKVIPLDAVYDDLVRTLAPEATVASKRTKYA